jgi:hypothetical protein
MTGSAFSGAADPLVSSIHSGGFESRAQLASDIEQRLDAQKDTLKSLKKDSKNLDGQARSDFKAAWDEVEAREKDLKRSLRELRNASQDRWESARSELAANYQAYNAAIARAQMQSGAPSVTFPSTSGGASGSVNSGASGSSGMSGSASGNDATRQNGRSGTSGSSATDRSATPTR